MNLLGYIRFRSTFSLWSLILSRIIQRERERERERERGDMIPRATGLLVNPLVFLCFVFFKTRKTLKWERRARFGCF